MAANNVIYKVFVDKLGDRSTLEFLGSPGDMFYDPGRGELRLSDGDTPGGVNTTINHDSSDDIARTMAVGACAKANGAAQRSFVRIEVPGESDLVMSSNVDILRLVGGTGIALTTNTSAKRVTITPNGVLDQTARDQANAAFAQANTRAGNVFSTISIQDKGSLLAVSNADMVTFSPGAGLDMGISGNTISLFSTINSFSTIEVAGQNTVVADANADTLTLVAGNGISITTNSVTDTITIMQTESIDATARQLANGAFAKLNNDPIILVASAIPITAPNVATDETIQTVVVPGGAMGPNGFVEIMANWTSDGSGNSRNVRVRANSGAAVVAATTMTTHLSSMQGAIIYNRSDPQQQLVTPVQSVLFGASASANVVELSINTNNDWSLFFAVSKTSANDMATLEQHRVIVQYKD